MRGFADLDDLDLIPTAEVAARMGYRSTGSLRRFLARGGADTPPALRRGWHRAGDVKEWFSNLPNLRPGKTQSGFQHAEFETRPGAFSGAIMSLDAERLRRKLCAV